MNPGKKANNYAYIDGANLYNGIRSLGWKLDYSRFRIWLTEKYNVEKAPDGDGTPQGSFS